MIQFCRYVPLVAARGGRVVVECQRELKRLVQGIAGTAEVAVQGEPLPAFDVYCPMGSLPQVFGTTLSTIPGTTPYIHADSQIAARWKARIEDGKFNVGLVWAGSPAHRNDRRRSMSLEMLSALSTLGGVQLYSLQKGPAAEQVEQLAGKIKVIGWTEELIDLADTAGLIANLDLVIAVDTSVAHLSGAMGKAVWTLLPAAPDWRWLLDRSDSPWYPSMRLFRQDRPGDWVGVIGRVKRELGEMLEKRR